MEHAVFTLRRRDRYDRTPIDALERRLDGADPAIRMTLQEDRVSFWSPGSMRTLKRRVAAALVEEFGPVDWHEHFRPVL
jgi:hypothetical protein